MALRSSTAGNVTTNAVSTGIRAERAGAQASLPFPATLRVRQQMALAGHERPLRADGGPARRCQYIGEAEGEETGRSAANPPCPAAATARSMPGCVSRVMDRRERMKGAFECVCVHT